MKFSYNWLKELVEFKDSPEELAEFLTLRVFEVEAVEKRGSDFALDVKILPNRVPDASGHLGLAKEIAALKNLELRTKNYELEAIESKQPVNEWLQVKIEATEDCPRYIAKVIDEVMVRPSPKWLKERLEVCGVQSINNVVDAANYVMLETGQPLHVFDFFKIKNMEILNSKPETLNPEQIASRLYGAGKSKIKNTKSKTLIVRRARKGEKLNALDEKTYELNPEVLVIADEIEPVAIAGIRGGANSGVSEKTKTIVLESANFEPARIRKGSRLLNLKTDASYRFEHGLDPNLAEMAINRLAELIVRVAKGEVAAGKIDVYLQKVTPHHLLLRIEYGNRLAGVSFPSVMYEAALKRLGFTHTPESHKRKPEDEWQKPKGLSVRGFAPRNHESKDAMGVNPWSSTYQKRRQGEYHVETPTVRKDLEREEDLIEEVIRVWGYEKIPSVKPVAPLAAAKQDDNLFWEERIKDFLAGGGFTEVFRYIFTGEAELKSFGLDWKYLIEVSNPLSADYRFLAGTPLPSYIQAAKENEAHFPTIRIFGLTKRFSKRKGNLVNPAPVRKNWVKGVDENKRLVLVWSERTINDEEIFLKLKGALDELFEAMGLAEHWYDDEIELGIKNKELRIFHPYRVAEIKIDNEKIGVIGELHPTIKKALKIKHSLVAAEIDAEKLISLAEKEVEYWPISRFPAVIRDIAVVVTEEEKTETITDVIENVGGKLLTDSDLFDYFQDETMKKGRKKSLAFHLVFQSTERTLTDKEIDSIMKKIIKTLEENGWLVRK